MRSALSLARSREKKKREREREKEKGKRLWTGYSFLPADPVFHLLNFGALKKDSARIN